MIYEENIAVLAKQNCLPKGLGLQCTPIWDRCVKVRLIPEAYNELARLPWRLGCARPQMMIAAHCKPGEAYTRLITATCEVGPGTTHLWILEICIWSLQILEITARFVFHNSIFGFSKCYLYSEFRK